MTTTIEHMQGLCYRLTARLRLAELEELFARELRRRRARKAESADATRQRAGDAAWNEALALARDAAYENALRDSELRVIGEPRFSWVEHEPGQDHAFTATFEVFPTVDLSGVSAIEIHPPSTTITDADVASALDVLRSGHRRFDPVTRAARPGDRVKFDYAGTIDGTAFDGGSAQGASAVLGEADVLDAMETALTGRAPGEVFETAITFASDYAQPSLRGKNADFHITVHSVAAPVFPELDSDFVQRLGVESGSLDELRKQVRQRLESECEHKRRRYERRQMIEALLEAVPVTVPEILLATEMERVRASFAKDSADGSSESAPDIPEQPLRATAQRRVALSLILSEIIRARDIRLDPQRVEKKLDELASGLARTDIDATKRQYRDNKQVMHNVQALVIEDQGFEALLQSVRRTPVSMSFDSLLQASE